MEATKETGTKYKAVEKENKVSTSCWTAETSEATVCVLKAETGRQN